MLLAPSPRAAPALRTVLATLFLLAFWTAIARAYRPEIAVGLLRVWQGLRGAGTVPVVSDCLEVRSIARLEPADLQQIIAALSDDCRALQAFHSGPPQRPIPVLVQEGGGPALTDGRRLLVYHDRGRVDLSTAPLLVALLWSGDLDLASMDLFLDASVALYAVEEAGLSPSLLGQSTEQWVTLMAERGALLPLDEARGVALPSAAGEQIDLVRAVLQGASFVRWMSRTAGMGTPADLLAGLDVEDVLGLPLLEAEERWLAWVEALDVAPIPCEQALRDDSPLRGTCSELDRLSR